MYAFEVKKIGTTSRPHSNLDMKQTFVSKHNFLYNHEVVIIIYTLYFYNKQVKLTAKNIKIYENLER